MSLGTFRGLGGDIEVTVDIVPDPETIQNELMQVAANLEDTYKPMLASRRVVQEDMQAHFDSESDPNGDKWTELDADYKRYKEAGGFPDNILIRNDDMRKAAVSDAAFTVTPQGLFFDWDALPKDKDGKVYGQILQAGSEIAMATSIADLAAQTASGGLREFGTGRGNDLPARAFVGMSKEAEATVWTVFDVWFDESIDVVIHPKTGVMQHYTPGRFGPKVKF